MQSYVRSVIEQKTTGTKEKGKKNDDNVTDVGGKGGLGTYNNQGEQRKARGESIHREKSLRVKTRAEGLLGGGINHIQEVPIKIGAI